jgi:epoxyqueuosine reductase
MAELDTGAVKQIFLELGADICGIAPAGRFGDAPEGFRPKDIYKECESVVVFAKRLPRGPLFASSCVPYTHQNDILLEKLDDIGYRASLELERLGANAVGVPSDDPSEYWEPERQYARGVLSLRHAAHLAGLGVLGRNTLLKSERFGNMVLLGAVLVDVELEGDPVLSHEACPPDCSICLDVCPQGALDGATVDQMLCRPLSNFTNPRGFKLYGCWECRRACPDALGAERS